MSIVIDPEFKSLLQPLSVEERAQLKENLIADGCREPLVLWHDKSHYPKLVQIVVDGHNRYEICGEANISYQTVVKDFPDRKAAMDWIDKNQLGRRNLTPDQMSAIRGRRYRRLKKPVGGQVGNRGNTRSELCGENCHTVSLTAERLAAEHGVSGKTIREDAKFAAAIELLPEVKEKIQKGEKVVKKDVIAAAKAKEEGNESESRKILEGKKAQPEHPSFAADDAQGKLDYIFGHAHVFDEIDRDILDVQAKVLSCAKHNPAFAFMCCTFVKQAIKRLRDTIKEYRPTAACQGCLGAGCDSCRGTGIMITKAERK